MRRTVTIYFPQKHQNEDVLGRLRQLAKRKDRSVNHLAVQALLEYVERVEGEN